MLLLRMHLDIPSGVVSATSCSNSSWVVVTYCTGTEVVSN
jgi:hypothetical protein